MPRIQQYFSRQAAAGFRTSDMGAESYERSAYRVGRSMEVEGAVLDRGLQSLSHAYKLWENNAAPTGPDGSQGVSNLDSLSKSLGGGAWSNPSSTEAPTQTPAEWSQKQTAATPQQPNPMAEWDNYFRSTMGGK